MMAKITYVNYEGIQTTIEVEEGLSIMEGAVLNSVKGIDGDCGGECACATCKVLIVGDNWIKTIGTGDEQERAMLEFREELPGSARLSCQIKVTREMDGLVVQMPENQDSAKFPEN